MIFSHGVSRNQRAIETGAITHILSEISKRRIEHTSEATGKGTQDRKDFSLRELSIKALISRISPDDLGFSVDDIPTDLRLEIFAELCKQEMPDIAIKLLEHSNIRHVRIVRHVTDKAIELLATLCPLIEVVFLRSHLITIKCLITLLQTCPNITSLDIGWTKVFDKADEADVRTFFQLFSPKLTTFVMRGTGPRHIQLRSELLAQHGQHIKFLNVGRSVFKKEHILPILSTCKQIENLLIDRMSINDDNIKEIVELCGANLKQIDIGDTHCTDKGLISIAQNCPNLEIIGLRNLPLVEVGVTLLSENTPNLKSIDLGGCYETTDVAIGALCKLTKLVEVNLEGLYLITEEKVKDLINSCIHINKIEIPENPPLITQAFRIATIKGREWRGMKYIPVFGY